MCAVLCSVVERISEEKQIEETSGDEAPVTYEKEAYLFSAPRSGTETKPILLSNKSSTSSLQASHAGIVHSRAAQSGEDEIAHDWRTARAWDHRQWPELYAATTWPRNCVRLAIEQHGQTSHRRLFIKYKRPSGDLNEESGKVKPSTR